jgi:hypothetical protein
LSLAVAASHDALIRFGYDRLAGFLVPGINTVTAEFKTGLASRAF